MPVGTEKRLVIQSKKTGLFFMAGVDCPSRWVANPLQADDRAGLLMLKDALCYSNGMLDGEECEIVEIEVTARLTGRKQDELYEDGKVRRPVVGSKTFDENNTEGRVMSNRYGAVDVELIEEYETVSLNEDQMVWDMARKAWRYGPLSVSRG